MQVFPVSNRSLDQLQDEIISVSERMNASEYEFLVLIREFDIRQGWKEWLFNNCAEWLNFKCGLSLGAAREKVRVANALFDLPLCSDAFADGSLSYSKARALTRIANQHTEQDLLAFAIDATASMVEDECRQLRNVQRKISTQDANRSFAARKLTRHNQDDGNISINIELPKELGELVMKAIEISAASLAMETDDCVDMKEGEFFSQQADALVHIARNFLSGDSSKQTSTADHYQVMIHVDEKALNSEAGKSDLPIESVRRITCDASIVEVSKDENGELLNASRKRRVVSPPLKRALLGRDKCCRFPGCTHDKWLDAHHVMHWADGGETTKENLMLLCSRHHRLLHEGGYTIHNNFAGNWYFRSATNKVISESPHYQPGIENASRDGFSEDFIAEPEMLYRVVA
jgi:hypothetical protein